MSIAYNFEVLAVDQAARVMEVVYTSEGRQTMHVGARLPYEGETLESVIAMYAPVAYWQSQDAVTQAVNVGESGSLTVDTPVVSNDLADVKNRKKAEIASARLAYEIAGVTVSGVNVMTDRESQALLFGAYTALKEGFVESLDWKTGNGSFVTVTVADVTLFAQALANHIQTAFATERDLVSQIDAAATEQEVSAVAWPQ